MPRRKKTIKNEKSKIKNAQEKDENYVRIDVNQEDEGKRLLMWAGIIFFMAVIGFIWVINMGKVFEETKLKSADNQNSEINWEEMRTEFSKTMDEVKKNIGEIKELTVSTSTPLEISTSTELEDINAASSASDLQNSATLTPEELDEFRSKLEELDKKIK
ncbi:MAG: hypothetical protein PHT51_01130 [Patescibacteria group bacterium]|nr:hypothetical protein [Patescibacteria group bacterium]MDD4611178.1 hypothetical protein [Patescibacteria group bacterium]